MATLGAGQLLPALQLQPVQEAHEELPKPLLLHLQGLEQQPWRHVGQRVLGIL